MTTIPIADLAPTAPKAHIMTRYRWKPRLNKGFRMIVTQGGIVALGWSSWQEYVWMQESSVKALTEAISAWEASQQVFDNAA